jgi:DNA-binding transcriptional MerR regulator
VSEPIVPASSAEKSDRAFRTISEAAETIGVPQHVLRFWETRFPQLQPLKRGGNRRYYRPADMELLETIRAMLHDQGLTIRGARLALAGGAELPKSTVPLTPRNPGRRATDYAPPDALPRGRRASDALPPAPSVVQTPRFAFSPGPSSGAGVVHFVEVDRDRLLAIRDRLRLALAA